MKLLKCKETDRNVATKDAVARKHLKKHLRGQNEILAMQMKD